MSTANCGNCGRFVARNDRVAKWDFEPGEYGEKLSTWPVSCRACTPAVLPCLTCNGQGEIPDPAHPIATSYEAMLFAGPPLLVPCPDCGDDR